MIGCCVALARVISCSYDFLPHVLRVLPLLGFFGGANGGGDGSGVADLLQLPLLRFFHFV